MVRILALSLLLCPVLVCGCGDDEQVAEPEPGAQKSTDTSNLAHEQVQNAAGAAVEYDR